MQIGVLKETHPGENRVALVPDTVKKLVKLGADIAVEAALGQGAGFTDTDYTDAGAGVSSDRSALLGQSDIILRIRKPDADEVGQLKQGCIHISYLDPFNEGELVTALAQQGVSAISMEMIPRTTLSQKMDALSSQANLAGYVAVMMAANRLDRLLPMMMTPAGTIKPARVFVIGAGVAGLQAIATAKRLGAKVTAFDTRPVVAEQVRSVGAKFLEIDLGETGQTQDGYAQELTPEQIEQQRLGQKAAIAESDIVITTAQVFGRKAPVLVTRDMVEAMQPGSVIVDMAAETGGNVAGSVAGQEVNVNGVAIIGHGNWPNFVCRDASAMYSSNLFNMVNEYWDKDNKSLALDQDNDIIKGCLITHGGAIVNDTIKNLQR
ncbi:MAG: Re/Si-specific NAD(P)(+) transhydrogenase subunit alpha [Gammaproteobacteria bacterium]|nr:Re/Si-specific NAD(P)(+) transhydrogenase subunit alpha [Gammaproteobacteria bacterium]MCY4211829.1 Re/Si-specific NAD(P)(+) transhydrogenase subunit alpha [Gammaproteobacteria bacterium]MCY4281317.1 Re/Si-specific NAD(P)(+) transhydrogenase subunit alpha [Gammaproteobacteria bacterium]MCY4339616.1 Re/Si-specific NAD(P)(+) transhydrogenase subunit alpha [Gammaproteobacteria bacterium]